MSANDGAQRTRWAERLLPALVPPVGHVGRGALALVRGFLAVSLLMLQTLDWLIVKPMRGGGLRVKSAVEHTVEYGVRSLPIVGLICFLIGAIMAMQSAYTLEAWGATRFIADLVAISGLRELAPLMTAILIAGRSGSAITAEIGTMQVAEEIDALHVMGLEPTKFLVVPKFLAMLVAVPCATVFAMLMMLLGGFVVGTTVAGVSPSVYWDQTVNAVSFGDLLTGLVKSVFFAMTIAWVGIFRGFRVAGGAAGVGRETTASVVTSIFLIIVVDLVWTTLFYLG